MIQQKCQGLFGKLFGHKMTDIIISEEKPTTQTPTPVPAFDLNAALSDALDAGLATDAAEITEAVMTGVRPPKLTIVVEHYKGTYCQRCGWSLEIKP